MIPYVIAHSSRLIQQLMVFDRWQQERSELEEALQAAKTAAELDNELPDLERRLEFKALHQALKEAQAAAAERCCAQLRDPDSLYHVYIQAKGLVEAC